MLGDTLPVGAIGDTLPVGPIGDTVPVGPIGDTIPVGPIGDTVEGVDVTSEDDTVPVGVDGGEPSSNVNWLLSRVYIYTFKGNDIITVGETEKR